MNSSIKVRNAIIRFADSDDAVLSLLEDINSIDANGRTPIFYAILANRNTLVSKLIGSGANVNHQDNEGRAPLHFAVQSRNVEIARTLLESSATVDVRDVHGNTPLWAAVMQFRDFEEMIKLLLVNGASPDQKNVYDKSPRDLARSQKGEPIVKLLDENVNG